MKSLAPEVRASALFGLLRHAYDRPAFVLAVRASGALSPTAAQAATAALEWLAHHGRITVWVADDALPTITRIPAVRIGILSASVVEEHSDDPEPQRFSISRPIGAPAPHSAAEQTLERHLARQPWATQRQWNRCPADLDPLQATVIVDLLWPAERVIVEVDGTDHRRPDKYAADRIRDNMLQCRDYLVLRYTNEQVLASPELVADQVRAALTARAARTPSEPIRPEEHATWTTRS